MKQVSAFNSKPTEIIEAEFRKPGARSNAEKLAETSYKRNQEEVLRVNLNSGFNPKQDSFVREYTVSAVSERKQNANERRASEAYGADALKVKLNQTRESLIVNRDNLNANKSLAFRPGMNQLALA